MPQDQDQPQVVVVTGASGGVGRAIAHAFAKRGAHVGLLARGRESLDDAAEEVRSLGGQALVVPTDVADADQVEAAAAAVEERFGAIDVWVNDAMATVFARFVDTDPDEYKRATEVTYLGFVYGTMAALRRMTERDQGTIVQVGSALSYRAIPLQAAYCGAKFAIRGFTDSIRTELLADRSRVRITMVQLPGVNTTAVQLVSLQALQTSACRCRRSTSPRSPLKPSTGPLNTRAASCGWATAPCRPSSATSSPPGSPTAIWPAARSAASRSTTCRSARTAPTTFTTRCPTGGHPRHLQRPGHQPQPAALGYHAPTRHRRGAERDRRRERRRAATMAMSEPSSPGRRTPATPHVLREYALLADGERGIARRPARRLRLDVLSALGLRRRLLRLIGGAGAYAVTPRDRCVWGGYYEPGTLIWRSRWVTADAIIECREALAAPGDPTAP